jgi:hypothetical protein
MKHNQTAPIGLLTKGEMAAPTPGPSQLTAKGKGKERATATGSTDNVPEQEDMADVGDAGIDNSGGADVNIGDADGASGSGDQRVPVSTTDSSAGVGAATGSTPKSLLQQMRLNLPTLQETGEHSFKTTPYTNYG